jgi:peptide/nickel transport system permease protein
MSLVTRPAGTGPFAQGWKVLRRNRLSIWSGVLLGLLIAVAVSGNAISPYDPGKTGAGPALLAPNWQYWMGTDELGRDITSRVIFGLRISLVVGLSSAALATGLGVVIGSVSGYFGGLIDDAMMRATEVFQVIPRFFLAVILVAIFGASLINIIVAISVLSWPVIARIVRAEFMTLKSRQFVDAARVAGASRGTLIFVEILPNTLGLVVVSATLQVAQAILLEAGLSYLGLSDPNQVSLGLMLQQASPIMRQAWWASAFPGFFIFLTVLALNLCGDGLNDVLSPRSRGR